jgi:hypothetical protein
MLPGLGHDRFIGRNHEQNKIDPSDPGQHVFDEFFMSRHVNEPNLNVTKVEMSESQVNRNASKLFFFQAVGIDSGQSPD